MQFLDNLSKALAIPYDNIFVVNMDTGQSVCYRMGQVLRKRYGDNFGNGYYEDIMRIEEVGDFIINISEELSLLAFNASIEAARVGQVGMGFTIMESFMDEMKVESILGMGTKVTMKKAIKKYEKSKEECMYV